MKHRLGVASKIWLSFGLLLSGYVLSTYLGYTGGIDTAQSLQRASDELFPASQQSAAIEGEFDEQTKAYLEAVMMGELEAIENAQQSSENCKERLTNILGMEGLSEERLSQVRSILSTHEAYSENASEYYEILASGEEVPSGSDENTASTLASQSEQLKSDFQALASACANDLRETLAEVGEETSANTDINLTVFASTASLGILLCFLIVSRSITQPLHKTVAMLRNIAEGTGDLTARLDAKNKDEVGEVGEWFNIFVEKIHGIVAQISKTAGIVQESSTKLAGTSQSLADGVDVVLYQAETTNNSSDEMSSNMVSLSAACTDVSEGIREVGTSIEDMRASIGEIAATADQASKIARDAAELAEVSHQKVGGLSNAANEIGRVIEVIQDIAEQTNLLALNATIEAARAGAAGKGFAVVATEVKELSSQTAAATHDIRHRIEAIQSSASDAVESIGEISGVVQSVNSVSATIASSVEEQNVTTQQIAGNVTTIIAATDRVTCGVSDSTCASREINSSITGINGAVQQTSAATEQTRLTSEELASLGQDLSDLVSSFKI